MDNHKKRNVSGERIKIARNSSSPKITQLDLSARLRVLDVMIGDSTIGKIENGTSAVTDIQLLAFAKALNVSALWLLGLED